MIALQMIGKRIQLQYGTKYVWGLYLGGALAGSIAMNYFMPYDPIQLPKVGADPCISTFISFMAVQNPMLIAFNFIIPVRLWLLLGMAVFFVTVSDSSFKNMGGLAMGVGLGLLKRKFPFWF